ncbi:carboxypeptidase-like regulatory domain-containing protein [Longimicrobium sp.]|uniref:carboxypeptidase-like regulatory domain-containing protein n=1 Tax=Longimicrobium sp. TaxID=2029185 RepID=UPI002E379A2D|nr:carboxypeptidase regulatory-like domain-containing protein [Longimicrobium sp.]HEX6040098.1 carboxypeptidase regulatory-like domain-containing protein [Longimicrobium sp.]
MVARALVIVLAWMAGTLCALPAAAQGHVSGQILDARTGEPVPGAFVSMLTSEGRFRRITGTDSVGKFSFDEVLPGRFRLNAGRIGYYTAQGGHMELEHNDTVTVDIRLSAGGVLLQAITVVARSQPRGNPMLRGFYERMDRGTGYYLNRDAVEARNASMVTDLLVTLPGVRLGPQTHAGRQIIMSRAMRSGSAGCPVQFFVDNVHVNRDTGAQLGRSVPMEPLSIDAYVQPSSIEGIEVYSGLSSLPAEFMTNEARCGTVVVWTRRGQ